MGTDHESLKNLVRINLPDDALAWPNPVGKLQTKDGRWLDIGLYPGSSDLILIQKKLITPEMVGTYIGRFGSLEIKQGKDKLGPKQINWLRVITEYGGAAGEVRCVEDMRRILGVV